MPTILVADDNSNIQKMVSLVFKEKGIRVVAVGNGEAACRKVPEVHPDVVLADVFMPVRNGYEVCEFVKQDPQFAETPVILLVGAFDPLDEKEAQRVGANGVLKKPFVPPEPLIAMVSSLLGKIEPPVEEPQVVPEAAPTPTPAPEMAVPAPRFTPAPASTEDEDTPDTVVAFGEPVATPSAKAQEMDESDDDSEPASEWARRRATMDYEIGAADSADMVEKLAAEGTVEEPEILPSKKQLPFGGANVPEALSAPVESSPVKWPELMASGGPGSELSAEKPEQESLAEETEAPVTPESSATDRFEDHPQVKSDLPHLAELALPSPAVEEAPLQTSDPEPLPETTSSWNAARLPEEPVVHSDHSIPEAGSNGWSLPQIPREPETLFIQPYKAPIEELSESDDAIPAPSQDQPRWQEAPERASESPLDVPEAASSVAAKETDSGPAKSDVLEAPVEETSSKAQVDQATVDDMVAKVLSKLEPQLHQALANGVLRPLVEELLNQQRDKR